MNYRILRFIAGCLVRLLFRIEIVDKGKVPASGGVIICANHIHLFDPVLIALAVERPIHFMGKAEIFSWPVIGYLARKAGAFPVRRGSADMQAIKHSLAILNSGAALGIFPEGTRNRNIELAPINQGILMLAEKSQVPIVPAAIWGSYRLGQKIKVGIGKSMELSALSPGQYSRAVAAQNLMEHIGALRDSLR